MVRCEGGITFDPNGPPEMVKRMVPSFRLTVAVALFLLTTPIPSSEQQKASANADGELITLSVTVRNREGQPVTGLNREAFELTDEKQVRPISFFENTGGPVSIGILIDTSGSMQLFELRETARVKPIGEAISQFLQLGNANNEYFMMAFDKTPRFLSNWTSGQALLAKKTDLVEGKGNTAVYDSCFAAIEKLQTAHYPRRALLLVSDGQDNISRHSFKELRQLLRTSDVTFYGIGVLTPSDIGSSLGLEGKSILTELAEITGGEAFFPEGKKQLNSVIEQIALELRHQYRMDFQSDKAEAPNKWRRLKLKLRPASNAPLDLNKLIVRTRQGYYTK